MKIIVDADSCPRDIREIIIKGGERKAVQTIFVANRTVAGLRSPAEYVGVSQEPGAADRYILETACSEDIVITRDIPLAAELVKRHITVINDRGGRFTEENARERLSIRNSMETMRNAGIVPPLKGKQYGNREKKQFADTFNRELSRVLTKLNRIP